MPASFDRIAGHQKNRISALKSWRESLRFVEIEENGRDAEIAGLAGIPCCRDKFERGIAH